MNRQTETRESANPIVVILKVRTALLACFSLLQVLFQQFENQGHIIGERGDEPSGWIGAGGVLEVQCFPLYTYLKALNVKTVDYFSLDIEGAEFGVLKTIPWDKVDIKVG